MSIRDLEWSSDEVHQGKIIRLKGMPEHLTMKMFSVAVSSNRTDFVVTNDNLKHCTDDTQLKFVPSGGMSSNFIVK